MTIPRNKVICRFCGSVLRLAQSEHITDSNGKTVIRQYWRCKTADCGQPYIDGKSKADCVRQAREKYSKKAREERLSQRRELKLIIHDEVGSKDPGEDLKAIRLAVDRSKERLGI